MNIFARGMPNQLLRLQEMHNGEKAQPTFSAGEMQRRQDAMRRILEELKLDAAILTSYHNICYFSDFLYCSFGRRYAFVITLEKATSVTAGIDAGQPWRRLADGSFETEVAAGGKVALLARLLADSAAVFLR